MIERSVKMRYDELLRVEREMRLQRQIERYRWARRYCHGLVVDACCGHGYGASIVSQDPEVLKVIAVDNDGAAIKYAKAEFQSKKIDFIVGDVRGMQMWSCDVLMLIECLQYFPDDEDVLVAALEQCSPDMVIASVPSYRTTHFNDYHKRDYEDGEKMVKEFQRHGYGWVEYDHVADSWMGSFTK